MFEENESLLNKKKYIYILENSGVELSITLAADLEKKGLRGFPPPEFMR